MNAAMIDEWRQRLAGNPVIARLQRAANELLGGELLVLLRDHDEMAEIDPPDDSGLPEFCHLYRANTAGMECCSTCRSAMAFGACYRGTIEYSCHGGVIIIASAVDTPDCGDVQPVVASCAFAQEDREAGWKELRDHAHGLGIDLRSMRAAYDRMPVLTNEHRKVATALVETGATALACQCKFLKAAGSGSETLATTQPLPEPSIAKLIESALYLAQTQSGQKRSARQGELLAEQIREMVMRNPTIPFTVKNIAAAARITPNYFSTIFKKATGVSFTAFLLEHRIALAQQRLRDLTLHVDEVGKRSGFPDGGYFTRRFRKATGMTPTQWRSSI